MSDPRNASAALAAAAAEIAELQQQLADAKQALLDHTAAAGAKYADLQAKFDVMYGDPVEPGITRGVAPYVTKDGQSHDTLAKARIHLVGLEVGVGASVAQEMVGKADTLIPLIQRAAQPRSDA